MTASGTPRPRAMWFNLKSNLNLNLKVEESKFKLRVMRLQVDLKFGASLSASGANSNFFEHFKLKFFQVATIQVATALLLLVHSDLE